MTRTLTYTTQQKALILGIALSIGTYTQAQQWTFVGNQLRSTSLFDSSIEFDNTGTPYIAFIGPTPNNPNSITQVMKYDGTDWVRVGGVNGISDGPSQGAVLAMDNTGTPYVAYLDNGLSGDISVKKYDGNSWVLQGPREAIATAPFFAPSMQISNSGVPHVAYRNENGEASVVFFNGTSWQHLGTVNITSGGASDIQLTFSNSGTPHLSYSINNEIYVLRYDGLNWIQLGVAITQARLIHRLQLDQNEVPHVLYFNQTNSLFEVRKLLINTWGLVGTGFPVANDDQLAFVIDNQNTVYVAHQDPVSERLAVKKFDGNNWVAVGAATGYSADRAQDIDLAVYNNIPHTIHMGIGNRILSVMKFEQGSSNNPCSIDPSVTQAGNTLTANQTLASYQWLDCTNGNTPIAGATGRSFTPEVSGSYAVEIITSNTCMETSNCFTVCTVDGSVSYNGTTLTATQDGATYQWIDCDNGNSPIVGATGQSYTPGVSGNYAVTVSANGCSETSSCQSVCVLDLSLDIDVGTGGATISVDQAGASYQWLDCNSNFALIPNATNQSYTASTTGSYAVEVTDNGCVDTTSCVSINLTGIEDDLLAAELQLFPNPTSGDITLDLGRVYPKIEVSVKNIYGQLISTATYEQADQVLTEISGKSGIYWVEVRSASGAVSVLKVIKK